ncbi:unnamed protein product [Paramecium sonneborni]|uniref:TLDc domain-containing protein n=1 Tax=Paramecium sonneborni TaxID=65129 RepID=A0A8S1REB5_9CILI|nr:unnamed protein product [Paramecium sonneborni]
MKQIPCFKHEGSFLLFIKVGKDKTEYICEECCLELQDKALNVNFDKLILIKKALKSPEFLLSKLNLAPNFIQFLNELDKYNEKSLNNLLLDFKTKIANIQNTLQAVYKELELQAKQFLEFKQKIRDELQKIIKFDSFKQFTGNLEQLGDSINPQAIEKNEKILHQYLLDLIKNDSKELNQTLNDILNSIKLEQKDQNQEQYPQFKTLLEQFNIFTSSQIQFQDQLDILYNGTKIESQLLQGNYKRRLNNTISYKLNKIIKSHQQIYLSTRDGLSGQSFWSKVNGKSNLLMIFKSKSGYIFGAFSPCLWQQTLNNYVQDNTLSSFLFSQTHDQIYPLTEGGKSNAIYCNQSYGPTFGNGYDLQIAADFNSGASNLGNSYQRSQYQIANYGIHLSGQSTPNIIECEIYQVIFA